MRLSEHLYVYFWNDPRENNCNTIFLNGKVPLLIDPGVAHRIDDLFARMHEDGLDPREVRLVICTHAHPDHLGGIIKFEDHAKIAISHAEEKYIKEIAETLPESKKGNLPDYKIDFYLQEGDLILGKHELRVIATPGHTPGGISIYWPRFKVLFPGDVIFDRAIGRTDLPGGDAKVLKDSLKKLAAVPIELIVPGHGGAVQGSAAVKSNFELALRQLK